MAQLENFWRIITPASRKQMYTSLAVDAYDPRNSSPGSASAISWYSQVMRGLGSRQSSYKQYDAMDADIDIARSLDIIAEEMSGKDSSTDLPFTIVYQTEENQEISETTVVTLRQALRQWSNLQQFDRRVFSIARCTVKYGDCFFRKHSDTKRWQPIDPSLVHGIEVDEEGNKVAYHIRPANVNGGLAFNPQNEQVEVVPAAGIIHFTLSDDMGDTAPFGSSVLRPIHRVYRQLSMLEDAVIIYRIVRAPERRVFYVDVGNIPPQRVKQYLEQIKNEMRQKKVPGQNGGQSVVDGQYDATSLQEDFFMPVTAAGRSSRVETLPGGTEDFGSTIIRMFQEKIFRGLRIPTSYMSGGGGSTDGGGGGGAQVSDGKVGLAYIEELRFANFIMRLQDRLAGVFSDEFKIYLKVLGLRIDDELFKLELPEPANFGLYRQAALDSDLAATYNSLSSDKSISRRLLLMKYLGWTEEDIAVNTVMVCEERGIKETDPISPMRQVYDEAIFANREKIDMDELRDDAEKLDKALDDVGDDGFDAPPPESNEAEPEAEPEAPAEEPAPAT